MFKSIEKLFKYGSFHSEQTHEFDTLKKLENHLEQTKGQEYIPECDWENMDESPKWTLEVSASNGTMFTIPIDL